MTFDLRTATVTWLFVVAAAIAGCAEKSDCEKACSRLARCKLAAQQGPPIMGERPPPPDEACMAKCQKQPDVFAACEGKKRDCDGLLACSGALR